LTEIKFKFEGGGGMIGQNVKNAGKVILVKDLLSEFRLDFNYPEEAWIEERR